MKNEVKERKEKKINPFLKALYNIFIADSDSLGGEIPGLGKIKPENEEEEKILEALKQSEKRIDDRLFKSSLKVTPAKVRALENDKKDNSNKKKNKEEKEISK